MLALALSCDLFETDQIVELHHFQPQKYYKDIIAGKSDGVARSAPEVRRRQRPALELDVEPPAAPILDILPDVHSRGTDDEDIVDDGRGHHEAMF